MYTSVTEGDEFDVKTHGAQLERKFPQSSSSTYMKATTQAIFRKVCPRAWVDSS